MDASIQKKVVKRLKEHFEANTFQTTDGMIDEVLKELDLPSTRNLRQELKQLAQEVHDQIQDEGFDYENVADQSFPASDPPPVP